MNGVDEFLCHKASLVKTKMMLQTHPHSHLCLLSNFSHVLLFATLYSRMAGSSVDGILQVRILEWIAISYSLGFSGPRDLTRILASPALAGGFLTSSATWEAPLSSVQSLVLSDSLRLNGLQHARLPCPIPNPELAQTHVHQGRDAIQPSHPLSSPSSPTFNLSQHEGLCQWVSSLHQVAKVLEFQLQHQSFQWIFSIDFL